MFQQIAIDLTPSSAENVDYILVIFTQYIIKIE